MSKMSRPVMELSERELKTLISAAVTTGIVEAQRTIDPDEGDRARIAVFEVDHAVERVINYIRENNYSPVVELADIQALEEVEIRKLSPDALKYLAGDRFVELVRDRLKI